jgi:hypothetical protein
MTTTPALTFRRTDEGYVAWPDDTASEFCAVIMRQADGVWWLGMTVCGLPLEHTTRPTLNEARDYARLVYATVEGAAATPAPTRVRSGFDGRVRLFTDDAEAARYAAELEWREGVAPTVEPAPERTR